MTKTGRKIILNYWEDLRENIFNSIDELREQIILDYHIRNISILLSFLESDELREHITKKPIHEKDFTLLSNKIFSDFNTKKNKCT